MKLMLNGKEVTGMGHYVMAGDIKDATAEDSNVLSGKTYYNNNGKREGTMPNRGGMSAELTAGGSVSIPEGYHNGEGVVRAQDLASQTPGDAGAGDIASGKTAWVNGALLTGSLVKGMKVATGTIKGTGDPNITISGLSFRPKGIFVSYYTSNSVSTISNSSATLSAFFNGSVGSLSESRGSSQYPQGRRISSSDVTITDTSIKIKCVVNFGSSYDYGYIVWGE